MNDLEKTIYDLTKPICDEENLELVSVSFKKEFGEYILEILIDKDGYVSTDDTTYVSEKLNILLDKLDPINDPYTLEVSSVGLERPLKNDEDIYKSINKYIHIDLKNNHLIGKLSINSIDATLTNFDGSDLFLELFIKGRKTKTTINKENIKFIRLAVKF